MSYQGYVQEKYQSTGNAVRKYVKISDIPAGDVARICQLVQHPKKHGYPLVPLVDDSSQQVC